MEGIGFIPRRRETLPAPTTSRQLPGPLLPGVPENTSAWRAKLTSLPQVRITSLRVK
jgi:hypothetical protein